MTSLAAGLSKVLPAPKYPTEENAPPSRKPTARILGSGDPEHAQLVLKVSFPTIYLRWSLGTNETLSPRKLAPRHMADGQDGALDPQMTLGMEALSLKFSSLNIHSIWVGKGGRAVVAGL